MGRNATLKPKWENGKNLWVISLPPALSSTGQRKREYFGSQKEAQSRAREIIKLKESSSKAVREAGTKLIEHAVNYDFMFRELYGYEEGLAQACEDLLGRLDSEQKSCSLLTLLENYESAKGNDWGQQYRTSWNTFCDDLNDLADRPMNVLTSEFWTKHLRQLAMTKEWGARTYNDKVSMLSSAWKHAVDQGTLERNPIDGVPRRKVPKKPVAVYSEQQVEALMACAWEHDREMVPFFALLVFAGLRPDQRDSEIAKIRWEDINFTERWIRVGALFDNKTETKRFVTMEDNLYLWLQPWEGKSGLVMPPNAVRRRRYITRGKYQSSPGTPESAWEELVPYGQKVRDVTRHTYGSYLDGKYRDRNLVKENMGHADFKTYDQHYRNARTPKQAEAFWGIVPPSE